MENKSLTTHHLPLRIGYSKLIIHHSQLKTYIFNHPEFVSFSQEMDALFADWKTRNTQLLKALTIGIKPKQTISRIAEDVLTTYTGKALMDKYDVYQHLLNYWHEVMQDDCYIIAVDGWKAELSIMKQTKSATVWDCDLVPKTLVINRYFAVESRFIASLEADKEAIATQLTELEEEHSTEDGLFAELDKVNKAKVSAELKVISDKLKKIEKNYELLVMNDKSSKEPQNSKLITQHSEQITFNSALITVFKLYLKLIDDQAELTKKIKIATADLDVKVIERYKTLTETEIKQLVVDDKWMASIERSVKTEMERISQRLTQRIKELAERYETPLPKQTTEVAEFETKVNVHLEKMGFLWN